MSRVDEQVLLEYVEASTEGGEQRVEDLTIGHDGAACDLHNLRLNTFSLHSFLIDFLI